MAAPSRPHYLATTLCVLSTYLRTHNHARHTSTEELRHVNERAVSDRRIVGHDRLYRNRESDRTLPFYSFFCLASAP